MKGNALMSYKKWFVQPEDLFNLNAEKARDLITKCFFEAQKETFYAAGKSLGQVPTDEQLHDIIVGAIRLAFRENNRDYDVPDKQALTEVVQVLARKAATRGTPPEIIAHHREQIGKVLAQRF